MSPAATLEPPSQVLVFALGDERYCVGIDQVEEIVATQPISPVPDSPRMVEGVMDLRGTTTTIVDPTVPFGVTGPVDQRQVIVFEADDQRRIGWLVDHGERVREFESPDVEPAEDTQQITGILNADEEFLFWVDPDPINSQIANSE
ncbi:chemotaxis protein CheW [Halococcoides cellulosivorans]|uniref:Chemotaxis protein CheW n=1 Tax=Halococcoides cellulosivorans TaxID=1679096 RepID=A0A2R4WXQ2_9EURY|nr:chemotaxis protein CheW [Halococcoides cellulosivorans]AWB26322.1 chemotaxis protein CheW [Halococcoides cellulosivorans]